jgi:group II intron reverse transcriptase/maturase
MAGTPSPSTISTKQQRIATLAREAPEMAFTSLSRSIDIEWLQEAYRLTRKNGAPGIDGQTAEKYAARLEENLQSLLNRAKSGMYRAPPVRRAHIPKGSGSETRPIGIPTFEDKVLQRAVAMVMEALYEQDFKDFSYGFRPGRSAHGALQAFWEQMMEMGGGWVLEVDIRKFFDTLDHGHIQELVRKRVRDGVLLRLIGKWLNAGVMEDGSVRHPEAGTPQGGVVSPLLANIYLHEVVDRWFESEVQPRLKGRAFLVRYADDLIIGLSSEEDARRVSKVLPKRFERYGLALHPEKTRLVPFRPRRGRPRSGDPTQEPGSFDFLGFTHYWGLSRKGAWVIKRKTAKGRLGRALQRVAEWCRRVLHRPVKEQHSDLSRKLRGHYAYYGLTGNGPSLSRFFHEVTKTWRKWLARRSQRGMDWERFNRMMRAFPLPTPVVIHSYQRHAAKP